MTDNIIKTEIKLSEESVKQIVIAEAAKAVCSVPNLIEGLIKEVLFYRVPTRYSSDVPNPTFFEGALQKTFKPIIEEEIVKIAESNRKEISSIIKKAFKSKVIDNKDFENRLIERLSKFSSCISFYVSEK